MHPIQKSANPQGKGVIGVLDSLHQAKSQLQVPPKTIQQISNELFTSLFVLNSQIRFKPSMHQTYWLYYKDDQYRLSLIAPAQWTVKKSGRFIGACQLQTDLTWTLDLDNDCAMDVAFMRKIAEQRQQLTRKMLEAERIDAVLPVYMQTLPYYSRILASALAYSLQQSMQKAGIYGLSYKQAERILVNQAQT